MRLSARRTPGVAGSGNRVLPKSEAGERGAQPRRPAMGDPSLGVGRFLAVPVHGDGEAGEDLEEVERGLTAELVELRERRRRAQRDIAQAGVLRLAIERTARDRSSGTTEEIEHTR